MKKVAKNAVLHILAWQVKRLRRKNKLKIIGISGSIGKTSTKFAVANVLKQRYRVRFQEGNYNDIVSVPLVFFGQSLPSLFNPLGWLKIFIKNESVIRKPYEFDFVVLELGTDGPGQINAFKKYLSLDIAVITAIAPEHMENFQTVDAVATEELSIASLSEKLFVNTDFCDDKYLRKLTGDYVRYGTDARNNFYLADTKYKQGTYIFKVKKGKEVILQASYPAVSKVQLISICAAVAVGYECSIDSQQLIEGVKSIKPAKGRMNILRGAKDSTIIDDTYNASPEAMKQALDALYQLSSPQKIAVLGSMNELGSLSQSAHSAIGRYCNPKYVETVVTIGKEANDHLAASAEKNGCKVQRFDSPYEAGNYLKTIIKPNATVLAKGSQNGVFAEEAVKQILEDASDKINLVRQSPRWLKIKRAQFKQGET